MQLQNSRFLRILFSYVPTAFNENITITMYVLWKYCSRYITRVSGSALSARARRLHGGGTGIAIIDIVDVCVSEPPPADNTEHSTALHCTADKTLITLGNNLIVAMIYFSIITTHYFIVFYVTYVLLLSMFAPPSWLDTAAFISW